MDESRGTKTKSGGFGSIAKSLQSIGDDIELLSDEERDEILATKWGTVRTIINAIISAGVLGLAFRMKESGSGTVALLMVVSTICIILTLDFLYQASLDFQVTGYIPLVEKAIGPNTGKFALLTLSFSRFGTITAYFNVLRDSIPWVAQSLAYGCVEADLGCPIEWYSSSVFIIGVVTTIFILPISCLSDPDVFAKISFTTFLHFFLFLCLVIYGMATFGPARDSTISGELGLNRTGEAWPEDPEEIFRFGAEAAITMAVLAFALSAHTTVMSIYSGIRFSDEEKADPRLREAVVTKINSGSASAVYVYYLFIALGSFYIFGDSVESNSLNSFPGNDPFAMVIRCTYFFEIGTSIPIFMYSFRRDLTAIFLPGSHSEEALDAFDERRKITKWVTTAILLAGSFGLAQVADLGIILSISGALFATFNVYIFPSILIMRTDRTTFTKKYCAPVVLIIGSISGFIGLLKELDNAGLSSIFGEE